MESETPTEADDNTEVINATFTADQIIRALIPDFELPLVGPLLDFVNVEEIIGELMTTTDIKRVGLDLPVRFAVSERLARLIHSQWIGENLDKLSEPRPAGRLYDLAVTAEAPTDAEDGLATVQTVCPICGRVGAVTADREGLSRWWAGEVVQKALPDLPRVAREQILSGMCPPCQVGLFG